jgi:hypothetical protein
MSMGKFIFNRRSRLAMLAGVLLLPVFAASQDNFDGGVLRGAYVLALDGSFVSAPPPFTGDVIALTASMLGRLEFDGSGLAWGEATLSFHHPEIPFGVVSRNALLGTYEVAPDGRTIFNVDEFPLDINGEPGPVRTNSFVLECYSVQRLMLSRCILHSLISYQQGPEPRNLPVTMAGELQRQY